MFNYSANSPVPLERKEHIKYLGVLVDLNLSLTQHIAFVTLKISESSDILSRFKLY